MLDLYFKKEKSNDYEQLNVDYTSKKEGEGRGTGQGVSDKRAGE